MARSRDILRKDGWAPKAVDKWVCNAIGAGIKPQSMHPTLAVKEQLQGLWANEADAAAITDKESRASRPGRLWSSPGRA